MNASNRRDLLGRLACATAAGLLAAPVPLAATEIDPHIAWGAEWRAVLDYCNGPGLGAANLEDIPEGRRMYELEELIANTPAATLPGVVVQLAVVMELHDPYPDNEADSKDLAALRNIRGTVRRLVGTGVVA